MDDFNPFRDNENSIDNPFRAPHKNTQRGDPRGLSFKMKANGEVYEGRAVNAAWVNSVIKRFHGHVGEAIKEMHCQLQEATDHSVAQTQKAFDSLKSENKALKSEIEALNEKISAFGSRLIAIEVAADDQKRANTTTKGELTKLRNMLKKEQAK